MMERGTMTSCINLLLTLIILIIFSVSLHGECLQTRILMMRNCSSFCLNTESQAPPADPAAGAPASPPAGGGEQATPAADPETIFPNLKSWREDLTKRLDLLNKTIIVAPVDDDETKKSKLSAQEVTKSIWMRMNEPKNSMINRKDQRSIANLLAELEDKLSSVGRKLFGIKWNSIPCGAGFVQAHCGSIAPCTP